MSQEKSRMDERWKRHRSIRASEASGKHAVNNADALSRGAMVQWNEWYNTRPSEVFLLELEAEEKMHMCASWL